MIPTERIFLFPIEYTIIILENYLPRFFNAYARVKSAPRVTRLSTGWLAAVFTRPIVCVVIIINDN